MINSIMESDERPDTFKEMRAIVAANLAEGHPVEMGGIAGSNSFSAIIGPVIAGSCPIRITWNADPNTEDAAYVEQLIERLLPKFRERSTSVHVDSPEEMEREVRKFLGGGMG